MGRGFGEKDDMGEGGWNTVIQYLLSAETE